jgi:hypothetical protein
MILPYRGISMCGTFRPGDLIQVVKVSIDELQPGDIVVFHWPHTDNQNQQVVHRVEARTRDGVITRGDRCRTADQTAVTDRHLIGRVSAVERDGQMRPVRGGWRGRMWATVLRLWRWIAPAVGWPYRCLRSTGLAGILWRPPLAQVHLETRTGQVVKYIHRNRTVASWWPAEGRFWCRKPYDLILPRPDVEPKL